MNIKLCKTIQNNISKNLFLLKKEHVKVKKENNTPKILAKGMNRVTELVGWLEYKETNKVFLWIINRFRFIKSSGLTFGRKANSRVRFSSNGIEITIKPNMKAIDA